MEVHVHCIYTWYVDQTGEKDKVVGWEVRSQQCMPGLLPVNKAGL